MPKKIPHTYVIGFFIIIVAALLTWFIPLEKFIKETVVVDGGEQTTMVFYHEDQLAEGHTLGSRPQTWQVLSVLFNGFVCRSNIIVFILMIGGAFLIKNQTKAIDVGIMSFLCCACRIESNATMRRLGVDNIIIVMVMLLFSAFVVIFGVSEETIAFVIILILLGFLLLIPAVTMDRRRHADSF